MSIPFTKILTFVNIIVVYLTNPVMSMRDLNRLREWIYRQLGWYDFMV